MLVLSLNIIILRNTGEMLGHLSMDILKSVTLRLDPWGCRFREYDYWSIFRFISLSMIDLIKNKRC